MSSSVLTVNFAFGDSTTRQYTVGTFAVNSVSVLQFKNRLQNFDKVNAELQKKVTNLADVLKSDNGYNLTGIKSATITTSQTQRIFDAATYTP